MCVADRAGTLDGDRSTDREVTMYHKRGWVLLLTMALVIGSCAGPDKLARQSREELEAGHVQEAYRKARKALQKEPGHGPAMQAMAAAGAEIVRQRQDQVLAYADLGDTLEAAEACLRLDDFRRELADYYVNLPSDPGFEADERRIREGGASIRYHRGQQLEADDRPRRAYDEYLAANELLPGYRDVEERIRTTAEAAIAVVAILPWQNQTDVPGLSLKMTDRIYAEVGRRITPRDFRFTLLMAREEVYDRIPLSALDDLSRSDAVAIGGELGADLVVVGRFFGLRSHRDLIDYSVSVYRPVEKTPPGQAKKEEGGPGRQGRGRDKDDPRAGFVEERLDIIRREMSVTVQYEFSVYDTRAGQVVATRSETVPVSVATVYTSFRPSAPTHEYRLYPAALARAEPDQKRRIDRGWKDHVGAWELTDLLAQVTAEDRRSSYRPEYRPQLYNYQGSRPVFLGDLPPPEEMARVALDRVWVPVLAVLRELDR